MARADYTAIPKDSNTQQPQQTGAGGHTRQASSVSNDQISPKTCHKRPTRRREEHPRHRNRNGDRKPTRIGDCSLAWAECAMIAKHEQKHIAAATDRRVGTLDKHLPSPTTKFPQKAPKRNTDRKRRRGQRRRRALSRPARAPTLAAAARAARARAAAAPDDRADAREGRRERRVGDWHGARVAAAAPPTTDSLGDDEDNDDEGRPVDAHDEHVPSCAHRRPRRPCSRRRRR